METQYLNAEHSTAGNVIKGFEGFLSTKDAMRKRQRIWKADDRWFSLSSKTSPSVSVLFVQGGGRWRFEQQGCGVDAPQQLCGRRSL
jgi:hypothetical protein